MQSNDGPRFNLTIGTAPVKFVWFRVAKCGTRSTLKLLREHVTSFELEQGFNKRFPRKKLLDHKKFSIVRDPYTRIVSGWNDKVLLKNPGFYDVTDLQLEKMCNFGYFVDWLVDQNPREVNNHFKRQSLLVPRDVSLIGRIERYEQDLRTILQKVGFQDVGEIPHSNKKNAPNQASLMTPRVIRLLNDYYERDFQRFGYTAKA